MQEAADLVSTALSHVTTYLGDLAAGTVDAVQDNPARRLFDLVSHHLQAHGYDAIVDQLVRNPSGPGERATAEAALRATTEGDPAFRNALTYAVGSVQVSGRGTYNPVSVHARTVHGIAGRDVNNTRKTKIGTGGLVAIIGGAVVLFLVCGMAGVLIASQVLGGSNGIAQGDCVVIDRAANRLAEVDCGQPGALTVTRVVRGGDNPMAYCDLARGGSFVDDRTGTLYCIQG